jgi:hypothetical protein
MDKTNPEVSSVVYNDLFSSASSYEDVVNQIQNPNLIKTNKIKNHSLNLDYFVSTVKEFEGFVFVKRWKIEFKDIHWNVMNELGEGARVGGKDKLHIDKLAQSFSRTIDYTQPVPILKVKTCFDEEGLTHYVLCEGFHRIEALMQLGYTEHVFDIYQYDPTSGLSESEATTLIQMMCNSAHKPSKSNSEEDIVLMITRLLSKPETTIINKTEDSITNFIEKCWPQARVNVKKSILKKVMKSWQTSTINGVPNPPIPSSFTAHTKFDATNLLEQDGRGYKIGGTLDEIRNEYGYILTEGSEKGYIINAMIKYRETGKKTYFILQTKKPTELEPISLKVSMIEAEVKGMENAFKKIIGIKENEEWNFPWRIAGRLPQLSEDGKSLILVDSENYKP